MGRLLCTRQRIAGELELYVAFRTSLQLPGFYRVPQRLVDNSEVGLVAHDPLGLGIELRLPPETTLVVRHLDPGTAVEDASADIQAVVEDALAQLDASGQSRRVPNPGIVFTAFSRAWGGNAFLIQDLADLLQAGAVGVELEDTINQRRFALHDPQPIVALILCGLHARISQSFAAGDATAFGLAGQAPARRVGDAHSLLLADHSFYAEH
ncbi:hypothetical protein [Sphingomonas sp. 3P27F8]|uniref:hypothetical protein n=1 Tax=Sphingomonas sp. 3P27F8 TaxID=2502213 RepID=UPI001BB173E4|nr:hypothetical protein [Sphingomonas sp. 3P27F8]